MFWLDLFLDLFEVSVHQVLFWRRTYPERAFAPSRQYGVPVMRAQHPWICRFISEHVRSLSQVLSDALAKPSAGRVDRVVLVLLDGDRRLETYHFDLDLLSWRDAGGGSGAADGGASEASAPPDGIIYGSVECRFRSLLLRLNSVLAGLTPLTPKDDLSFTFELHATEQIALTHAGQDLKWCVASDDAGVGGRKSSETAEERIVPIYGMVTPIQLQFYANVLP